MTAVNRRSKPILTLDFTAEPQIIVSDISEKPTDDPGQRETNGADDAGRLLRAHHRIGLGVIGELPVAASERCGSDTRRRGRFRRYRPRRHEAPII